ncbi:MAG: hypothetical protein IJK36_01955 [Bacteroidales bacterium]|nr:hypothetical protein [Bacteroidales bacterium]
MSFFNTDKRKTTHNNPFLAQKYRFFVPRKPLLQTNTQKRVILPIAKPFFCYIFAPTDIKKE